KAPWSERIRNLVRQAKHWGYSDVQLANVWNMSERDFRKMRVELLKPVYKLVDTCAAEFEAATPYYYSTYEQPFRKIGTTPTATERPIPGHEDLVVDDEIRITDKPKVII